MKDSANPLRDCTPDTCMYGGWRSTDIDPPAFHRPAYFGTMKMVGVSSTEGFGFFPGCGAPGDE